MLKRVFNLSVTAIVGIAIALLMLEAFFSYQSARILEQYILEPVGAFYETAEGMATVRDYDNVRNRYEPYVVWLNADYASEMVNVIDGVRATPGAVCDDDSYRVFVFGGSTVFGYMSPDDRTIPAYLQQILAEERDEPVCVVNHGVEGYTTTQDAIRLLQRLHMGDVPDVAIFYNGANDIIMAADFGLHAHANQPRGALRFERPLEAALSENSVVYGTLRNSFRPYAQDIPAMARVPATPEGIALIYETNYTMVETLAEAYGFEMGFLLQPLLPIAAKEVTENEQYLLSRIALKYDTLQVDTYTLLAERMAGQAHFHDISGVFDGETANVWIDEVHIAPPEHERIAELILERVGR